MEWRMKITSRPSETEKGTYRLNRRSGVPNSLLGHVSEWHKSGTLASQNRAFYRQTMPNNASTQLTDLKGEAR